MRQHDGAGANASNAEAAGGGPRVVVDSGGAWSLLVVGDRRDCLQSSAAGQTTRCCGRRTIAHSRWLAEGERSTVGGRQ